ncbi:MAG: hypothetical protein K2Y32_10775 [Candidatus Obscuribacterales bacterium]|nr:hypothetical protein [Candidatus Obscuribacterales bacterium]
MFDASKLLGVSLKSGEWLHFKKKAGDVVKEQLGTKTQTTYFSHSMGLHLEYDKGKQRFDGIWIYFSEEHGYGTYSCTLPFGITSSDTREAVQSRLMKSPFTSGPYKRSEPIPENGFTDEEWIQYMQRDVTEPPTMAWDQYLIEPYSLIAYFYVAAPHGISFMHLSLATDGDRKHAEIREIAQNDPNRAAELLAERSALSQRSFSYTSHLEIADLYDRAGNLIDAEKHLKEAVERGTRETYGACKQSLLLKYAGFFERQGKDKHALHLLFEAHQDGKRRKTYLSEEIEAKLRLLASKLALPEEQLEEMLASRAVSGE